jgi:hypothetical protein
MTLEQMLDIHGRENMRKLALAISVLLVSFNVSAATSSDLGSTITKSIGKQNTNNGQSSTIVYGGKDISRSIVAVANESTWTKQQTLIG